VLVQKLDALEALTHIDTVVFDKTGTLTEDRLVPAEVVRLADPAADPATWGTRATADLLSLAASLGEQSRHPLARALAQARSQGRDEVASSRDDMVPQAPQWLDVTEQAGAGMQARLGTSDGGGGDVSSWRLGSAAWCGLVAGAGDGSARPAVWLARLDGATWRAQARFEFDEVLRPDAGAAVQTLQQRGLKVRLLSGDQPASVGALLSRLLAGGDKTSTGSIAWRALCTPQDKLDDLEALQRAGRHVLMVGDGINDAPVLARADVSVAMGSAAALAQARADVVVLSNRIQDIADLHRGAARCMSIVRQNLTWAVVYNLACVPLALAGWLPPWAAGLGMAGSSLLVVLNALRLTRSKDVERQAPAASAGQPAATAALRAQAALSTSNSPSASSDVVAGAVVQR
jgi:Cu2+-exporting ATPase